MSMYGPSWRDDLYGDYIDTGDDLMHYGVLGMRWGHRKGSSGGSSGSSRSGNKKGSSKRSKRLKKAAAVAGAAALAGGAAYLYSKNRNKGGNALAVVNNQPQQSSRKASAKPNTTALAAPNRNKSIQKSAAQKRWEMTRSQKDFDKMMSNRKNRMVF